jgi:PhnB protein
MKALAYLNFDGNCREAFEFYARALKGKIAFIQTFGDSPFKDQMPPEAQNRVLHVRLEAGDTALLGSDSHPAMGFAGTHGFAVALLFDRPEEVDPVFNALAEGGKVDMPVDKTFWSARFGMCTDKYGIPWILNCEREPQ